MVVERRRPLRNGELNLTHSEKKQVTILGQDSQDEAAGPASQIETGRGLGVQ